MSSLFLQKKQKKQKEDNRRKMDAWFSPEMTKDRAMWIEIALSQRSIMPYIISISSPDEKE